jgi:peroxiredoxin
VSACTRGLAAATLLCWALLAGRGASAEGRPEAQALRLQDLDGKPVSLADHRGEVVVLSFWATWCKPCLLEQDLLAELQEKHRARGLTVLAVSTDGPETRSQVRMTAKRKRWGMAVLLDPDGAAMGRWNPRGKIPYTVFIDRAGRVAHVHEGYQGGDAAGYRAKVEALLDEK